MLRNQLFALSLGFGGVILATQHALGQPATPAATQCAARASIVEALRRDWGETRRGIGLAGDNMVVEVFASAATGSWTITATTAGGVTCLIASGQNFEPLSEPAPAAGDGA
ncbi:hypothetical protein [Albidovulum sp.]